MNESNSNFKLNDILQNDCFEIGEYQDILILVMNNSLYDWLILVPKTNIVEFYLLPGKLKESIWMLNDKISRNLINDFNNIKVNFACIGNVVQQLHFHIVGRKKSDPSWPGVVWGHSESKKYTALQKQKVKKIIANL